jgi:type I restriction enzyme S subunit
MDKKFLYRLIQTQQFDEVANQSSGSKMPRADWNLVSNTGFIIPSSEDEQRQIAETFDDLDTLITLHQRERKYLDPEVTYARSNKKNRFIL